MRPIEAIAQFAGAERRLAEVERALEDSAAAERDLDALRRIYTPYHDGRAAACRARILDLDAKQALLLERERLQEESFRVLQRAREVSDTGNAPGGRP